MNNNQTDIEKAVDTQREPIVSTLEEDNSIDNVPDNVDTSSGDIKENSEFFLYLIVYTIVLAASLTARLVKSGFSDGGTPVFDEKHYATQAMQMVVNGSIENNPGYGLVVHPPLGKFLMSIGEHIFGYTPMGWRFMGVLAGVAVTLMLCMMMHRLSHSPSLVLLTGIAATLEGTMFTMSRTAMLDIYQVLFITMIALCMVFYATSDYDKKGTPWHQRYWLLLAGIASGLAMSVKISGVYYPFAIGVVLLVHTLFSRRGTSSQEDTAVIESHDISTKPSPDMASEDTLQVEYDDSNAVSTATEKAPRESSNEINETNNDTTSSSRVSMFTLERMAHLGKGIAFGLFSLFLVPMFIFFVSYIQWFRSATSWSRFSIEQGTSVIDYPEWVKTLFPDSVLSFVAMYKDILDFHTSLTTSEGNTHPWESKPWQWLFAERPMLMLSDVADNGQSAQLWLLGNLGIWYMLVPMFLYGVYRMIRKDVGWSVAVLGFLTGFIPWLLAYDRQMYFFYAAALAPFIVLMCGLTVRDISNTLSFRLWRNESTFARKEIIYLLVGLVSLIPAVLFFVHYVPWLYGIYIDDSLHDKYILFDSWKSISDSKENYGWESISVLRSLIPKS